MDNDDWRSDPDGDLSELSPLTHHIHAVIKRSLNDAWEPDFLHRMLREVRASYVKGVADES